jgi:hypothetical protein
MAAAFTSLRQKRSGCWPQIRSNDSPTKGRMASAMEPELLVDVVLVVDGAAPVLKGSGPFRVIR